MSTDKSMKDLIDEYGKEARDRWREVFDESRARGADVVEASKIADDVIRLEVERRVLVPCDEWKIDSRARSLVRFVRSATGRDGKSIDPDYAERICSEAASIVRELDA